jgi:hypothetical protein
MKTQEMNDWTVRYGKENLVISFYIGEQPIGNDGSNVLLQCELYRSDDVDDCIETVLSMDSDLYLDLLIEKGKYNGDGDVYFSSNIIDDFYKLSRQLKEKTKRLIITDGVLASYNEKDGSFKIIKEIN